MKIGMKFEFELHEDNENRSFLIVTDDNEDFGRTVYKGPDTEDKLKRLIALLEEFDKEEA